MIGAIDDELNLKTSAAKNDDTEHGCAKRSSGEGAVCRLAKASLLPREAPKCESAKLLGDSDSYAVKKRLPERQLGFDRKSSELEVYDQGESLGSVTLTETVFYSFEAKDSRTKDNDHNEDIFDKLCKDSNLKLTTCQEESVRYQSITVTGAEDLGSDVDFQYTGSSFHRGPTERAIRSERPPRLNCGCSKTPALKALNPITEASSAHSPDESITNTFSNQSQSFELLPDKRHCFLWRNSRGEDESAEPDSPGFFGSCKQFVKSIFQRLSSTEFYDPTDAKRIMIQLPSGPVSFGCSLKSVRRKDRKWFHYLHSEDPADPDSLASQLGIQQNDEVLMLNGEVVVFIDNGQVLLKFKQVAKSSSLDLVIRRQTASQDLEKHFLFIRITTELCVNEQKIQAEKAHRVTSSNEIIWSNSDWTTINQDDQQLCVRSNRLAVKDKDTDDPAVFGRTVFCALPDFKYYSVFKHRDSGRYVTVVDKKCVLGPANQTPPNQVKDSRVFCVAEPDETTCFIESVTYKDCYMALLSGDMCDHGGAEHLCLKHTTRPTTSDYVAWTLETPP